MKYRIITLLIGLTFIFSNTLNASHIAGGEVRYNYLGNNQYKVVYKLYRNCRGVDINTIDFTVSCADGSFAKALNCTRISIRDISNICPKDSLPCNPRNAPSTNEGLEEHIFVGIVDFSASPYNAIKSNCCQAVFSAQTCCRSGSITTLGPDSFFVEAMVDLCKTRTKGNNSAEFRIPPVTTTCCNNPFFYDPGISEAEGDSLSYELVAPLKKFNTKVSFTGSFNDSIPMTPYCPPNPGVINCRPLPNAKPPRGFYFDRTSGSVAFTPTKCDEVGVLAFKVSEWRKDSTGKMVLVGYTKRETLLSILTCTANNSPYFTGNTNYSVCEGNTLCISIASKDDPSLPQQTVADTITLSWDTGIAAGSFSIIDSSAREKTAEFCWQPKQGDARKVPYKFSVIASDNFCTPPAITTRTYTVTVKPKAKAKRYYNRLHFGKMQFWAVPEDTINVPLRSYTFQFFVRDSTNSGTPLYTSNKINDSFAFPAAGKYYIALQVNNPPYNCPTLYVDTIYITQQHMMGVPVLSKRDVTIFPNPGDGTIHITSDELDLDHAFIKVYDVYGKFVTEAKLGTDHLADISHLASGVYTIMIQASGEVAIRQLLIE